MLKVFDAHKAYRDGRSYIESTMSPDGHYDLQLHGTRTIDNGDFEEIGFLSLNPGDRPTGDEPTISRVLDEAEKWKVEGIAFRVGKETYPERLTSKATGRLKEAGWRKA